MDTSLLIGRLFSAVYMAVGLGMLLRPAHYQRMANDFMNGAGLMYIGGVIALLVGLLIVTFHNVWSGGWVVLLTIVGWAALIKGALILIAPDVMVARWRKLMTSEKLIRLWGLFALVVGLVIAWFSYCGACGQAG